MGNTPLSKEREHSNSFEWCNRINLINKNEVAAPTYNIADNNTSMANSRTLIRLFVRMVGKLKEQRIQRTRFYCDLLRIAVLSWPA